MDDKSEITVAFGKPSPEDEKYIWEGKLPPAQTEPIQVMQLDRDAAQAYFDARKGGASFSEHLAEAFAAHRIATEQAGMMDKVPPAPPVAPAPLDAGKLAARLAAYVWEISPIGSIGRMELTSYIRKEIEAALAPVAKEETGQPVTDNNPDIREIAFDFVGDLGLPEHRSKEWLSGRTERLIKRIVAVVNKYRESHELREWHEGYMAGLNRAAQPAGTPEQARKDALEQAAQLANERMREKGFYAAWAEQVAREIRALATPQVQQGQGEGR